MDKTEIKMECVKLVIQKEMSFSTYAANHKDPMTSDQIIDEAEKLSLYISKP